MKVNLSGLVSFLAIVSNAAAQIANLTAVLNQLGDEIPSCAQTCFASITTSETSCRFVNDFITTSLTSCLQSSCTSHQRLEVQKLVTTTCGTETRDIANRVRAIYWSLYVGAAVFITGRLLARSSYFGGMTFGWDDWTILASFVVLTAVSIGAELMVVFGLGQDMWMLDDLHINVVLILFYIAEFAYTIEVTLTKVSILLLYLRIFPDRQFRNYCFILMAILTLFAMAFVITLLTYCQPFSYVWLRWDNEYSGRCIDMNAQTYACAALNIVLDLLIFILPIPQLWVLDMTWTKKFSIIFMFLVGLFVTICSVIRLKVLVGWNKSANPTWDYTYLAVWSLIELDVGVICACMPGMASLFRRVKQRRSEYIKSNGSRNTSQMFGGGSRRVTNDKGSQQAITKTTMVSVEHKRIEHEGQANDFEEHDELELVERKRAHFEVPSRYVHDI